MAIDFSNIDLGAIGVKSFEDASKGASKKNELGQDAFLTLMTTQLKNQDPLKPMENGEFLSQLAQFSSVAGLQDLNESFAQLSSSVVSSQALQASSLLGRTVLVEGDTAALAAGGTLSGGVDVDASAANVRIQIKNTAGAVVGQFDLGPREAGMTEFEWDGKLADGSDAPAGTYAFSALTFDGSGAAPQAAKTLVQSSVESVTLGAGQTGMTLSIKGLGDVAFSAVRRIG